MKTCYSVFSLVAAISMANIAICQSLIPYAVGLISPVSITNAGDSRLFVVNQQGTVIIVDSTGKVNPESFLDISDRVVYGGERGLLGLAFHPEYNTNGQLYVNYIGEGDSTHISRFSVKAGNPQKADSLSEYKILTIAQPFQNHKGGNLCFGPDGYLYIGMGDGGSGGDPGDRAQNQRVLLGKMLRIDIDHGSPYSIPASNPFYNSNIARNEIWALGLRNPWKFSFDRLIGQFSGLPESEKPIDIRVFQSQSSNRIRLEIEGDIPLETSIHVYDIKGIERFRTKTHDNTFEFSLEGLLPGIYVLAVVSDGKKLVNKIVVGR